jgi:predicted ATPase/class 3 adenylate cyclase
MLDGRETQADLPTGTVTFLRTDVEGSMGLAHAVGARWDQINATHLGLIRAAVNAHGGVCVRTEGDAFFGVFREAGAAVSAAVDAQRSLNAHPWPQDAPVKVRMGLHSGEAHLAGDDYGGFDVNRAARIAAAGHGGQVILSEPTRLLAEPALAGGIAARDLGRHVLRDVPAPERLFQLDIPGLRADFPPLRTSRPSAGNVPMRMTSFLGREEELGELRDLLATSRLVTLTGPGGIGKTSLAVELAREWADTVSDGAWLVALDAIQDAALVPSVIARTLGLFDGPDRPAAEGLARFVADRSLLLVIDNFEHVLDAAGEVAAILRVSAGTQIVVTSRAPLRIPGEQEYPVRPLQVRGAASSELFTQRARAVRPGWDQGSDTDVVEEICALLDGLPLGIELAAARVSLLPLRAIRDRLAARLPLPGSGPRGVPDRQRTLDGAIAWSHELLAPGEQRLLHELAIFEGGFDADQAAIVSQADVLDGLGALVDHSLVARQIGDDVAGIRFRLLQTIRSFALDRLVAERRETELSRRHAIAYVALAEEAATHLPGPDQPRWLDRLAMDHANLRAAVRWAIDAGEVDLALRFVASLWRFWQLDGHLSEGHDLAAAALAMPGAEAPTPARLGAIAAAGGIAYWRSEAREAVRLYEEQRVLAEQLGDSAAEADAFFNLAFAKFIFADVDAGLAAVDEARRRFRELGDERGVARTVWAAGSVALQQGRPLEAIPIFEEAMSTLERIGDVWYHTMVADSLAWANFTLGNIPKASRWAVRSLVEHHALRDTATTTISMPAGAILALEAGQPEDAAVLMGAFENLCDVHGVRPPIGLEHLIAGGNLAERLSAALDAQHIAEAMDRGRRLTLDEAVAIVVRIGESIERGTSAPPAS